MLIFIRFTIHPKKFETIFPKQLGLKMKKEVNTVKQ